MVFSFFLHLTLPQEAKTYIEVLENVLTLILYIDEFSSDTKILC